MIKKMPFEQRRQYVGVAFLSHWIIGVALFFVIPLMSAAWYVFCDVKFSSEGLIATFCGLENIRERLSNTVYSRGNWKYGC